MTNGIECDGGPYCHATEHIEGCFATARPHGLTGDAGEVERLRTHLAGAMSDRDKLAAYLAWKLAPYGEAPMTWDEMVSMLLRLGQLRSAGQRRSGSSPSSDLPKET